MAAPLQGDIPGFDTFLHPTQDDYERAKEKSLQLLRTVVPESTWSSLEVRGIIQYVGKRGTYLISPYSQTEIRDSASGKCVAYACLQLSIPAPTYDRMVAEYLLIRNCEDFYWKTANIFSRQEDEYGMATLLLAVFDFALLLNAVLELLSNR